MKHQWKLGLPDRPWASLLAYYDVQWVNGVAYHREK